MAKPHACRSLCWNPPPDGEDELADAAPVEGSGPPTHTPVVSCAPTSAPAIAHAAAPSLDNELFKQFIKAYLEAQIPWRTELDSKPREQPLKARFPDFYYSN